MNNFIDYDIDLIVSTLGLRQLRDMGDYYRCQCEYHNDSNPSMHIMKGVIRSEIKGLVKCMSCGVITHISKLVEYMTNENFYIKYNIQRNYFNHLFVQNLQKKKKIKKIEKIERQMITTKGELLEVKSNPDLYKYLTEVRDISDDFIDEFGIKYVKKLVINDQKPYYVDRFVIPIYDIDGTLISYEGRIYKNVDYIKCLYSKGGSVDTLWNYNRLDKNKVVYIVEGIMAASTIWKYVSKNVTCTFGKLITNKQKTLLNTLPKICLIPDNDRNKRTKKGNIVDNVMEWIDVFEKFYEYSFDVVDIPNIGNDPNDEKNNMVEIMKNNRYFYTEYLLNSLGVLKKPKIENWS
jgi:DNA primase